MSSKVISLNTKLAEMVRTKMLCFVLPGAPSASSNPFNLKQNGIYRYFMNTQQFIKCVFDCKPPCIVKHPASLP